MTLALGESTHESQQSKKQEDKDGDFKACLGHPAGTQKKKKKRKEKKRKEKSQFFKPWLHSSRWEFKAILLLKATCQSLLSLVVSSVDEDQHQAAQPQN